MDPNVWGPVTWDVLFTLSLRCASTHFAELSTLYRLLEHVLPCPSCRRSYIVTRKALVAPTAADPDSCVRWLWSVHDVVNQKLGKVCITLDALRLKHATLSPIVSDGNILDVLVVFALAAKPERVAMVVQTARILSVLTRAAFPWYQLPILLDDLGEPKSAAELETALHTVATRLAAAQDAPCQPLDAWKRRYMQAYE